MTSSEAAAKAEWPRAFRMAPSSGSTRPTFWTHELYRGPDSRPVRILYSRTKMQSEEIAHEFIGERVVGFDMEWPFQPRDETNVPLQKRVGLIQIASEHTIGLFHIGLHVGQTSRDVLAPTLRRIIESEDITKTGVAILNADFSRLRRWFDLKPRGAFELSHLHNLVTYGEKCPTKVTTRMKALTKLVEEHLGLPLFKGKVRTSNWSQPLKKDQIQYAAADAYAGIMLYHCMNAKRLSMNPVPMIPLHAETYIPMGQGMAPIVPVQLGPSSKAESGMTALEFVQQASTGSAEQPTRGDSALPTTLPEDEDIQSEDKTEKPDKLQDPADNALRSDDQILLSPETHGGSALKRGPLVEVRPATTTSPAGAGEDVDLVAVGRIGRQLILEPRKTGAAGASSKVPELRRPEPLQQVAYQAEAVPKHKAAPWRQEAQNPTPDASKALLAQLSAHRKRVAQEKGCPAFVVASNTLLTTISEKCPRSDSELLQISGIGKVKAGLYGPAWLKIVNEFLGTRANVCPRNESLEPQAIMPTTPASRQTSMTEAMNQASGGYGRTPAILHTGLSFRMENATLETEADHSIIVISDDSDDGGSAFGSPVRSLSPSTLKRKRECLESLLRDRPNQRPVLPQPQFQPQRMAGNASRPPTVQAHSSQADIAEARATEKVVPSPREGKRFQPTDPQPGTEAPKQILAPQTAVPRPAPQASFEIRFLRRKLLAFNRRIAPAVILPDAAIEHIILKPPETAQELLHIPGIMPFANACARQNECLFSFITRSTQKSACLGL